ncbi:SDR family NAD(P)-dependent oxidoreductase [Sorangium sp. So ce1078]|uniref:SDR family NAD(P)-dependent oxidoreductase n=1 Tax=Sorangium sp. So ce1078 TaxID=3133329 RepID=UPI003F5F294E
MRRRARTQIAGAGISSELHVHPGRTDSSRSRPTRTSANEPDVIKLFGEAKRAYGKVDILINNAGVFSFAPVEGVTVEDFHRQFDTNVLGIFLAIKHASPLFPETGASIINISSVVSTLAPASASIYSATKGAVDTITRSLAKELGPRNVRVNAINPGMVATEGVESLGDLGSEFLKQGAAVTPLGRHGQPDDVALPAVFLASDDARWISGETIYVSGGASV